MPRAEAVDLVLADPAMQRMIKALLPQMEDLRNLRARALDGAVVAATPNLPEREPLPASIEELDWAVGVRVSPISGGPLYAGAARNYRCATIEVHGISSSDDYDLTQMIRDDVTLHSSGDSSARVSLNLPGHSGLYLLSFRLSAQRPEAFPEDDVRLTVAFSTWIGDVVDLPFTRSPDSDALVALLEIPSDHTPMDTHADPPLEQMTLTVRLAWPEADCPMYFGGVTVTRL